MDQNLELAQALLNAVVRLEHRNTTLTLNEANRIHGIIAVVLGMNQQELTQKMAEYYCRHRSQLEILNKRRDMEKFKAVLAVLDT